MTAGYCGIAGIGKPNACVGSNSHFDGARLCRPDQPQRVAGKEPQEVQDLTAHNTLRVVLSHTPALQNENSCCVVKRLFAGQPCGDVE